MSNEMEVAQTILEQMGGAGRIKLMTGAKLFLAIPPKIREDGTTNPYGEMRGGVSIKFPKPVGKNNPNYCKILLNDMDTYDVWFQKDQKILHHSSDVYAGELLRLFEEKTGLYLRLAHRKKGSSKWDDPVEIHKYAQRIVQTAKALGLRCWEEHYSAPFSQIVFLEVPKSAAEVNEQDVILSLNWKDVGSIGKYDVYLHEGLYLYVSLSANGCTVHVGKVPEERRLASRKNGSTKWEDLYHEKYKDTNWYVPIEIHKHAQDIVRVAQQFGFKSWERHPALGSIEEAPFWQQVYVCEERVGRQFDCDALIESLGWKATGKKYHEYDIYKHRDLPIYVRYRDLDNGCWIAVGIAPG